jgi:hypothetical protein
LKTAIGGMELPAAFAQARRQEWGTLKRSLACPWLLTSRKAFIAICMPLWCFEDCIFRTHFIIQIKVMFYSTSRELHACKLLNFFTYNLVILLAGI